MDNIKPKQHENGNINAEIAENLQNRPTDGDFISRQAAIDALFDKMDEPHHADFLYCDEIRNVIDALPTVQPNHNADVSKMEIIHCKGCKRFRKPSSIVNADWGWCSGWPTPLTTFVKVDGFCHRAERRDEA